MNANGILRKHWLHAALHFAVDAVLFILAFSLAYLLRFGDVLHIGDEATQHASFARQWPCIALAALVFSSATYITGLYSTHSATQGYYRRSFILAVVNLLSVLVLIGVTYASFIVPIGRGLAIMGSFIAYCFILVHHAFLLHALRTTRERVIYLVTSAFDEAETHLLSSFGGRNFQLVGIVTACGYQPHGAWPVLGTVADLPEIVSRERISRVLCTSKNLSNAQLTKHFCTLRYSGVSVIPLIILCEEIEQYVPLELVSHEWLLNASGEPHLLYIKKLKRFFDVMAAALGLLLGAPIVAAAAVAIKLTSPGPIFYRQTRAGRFGRIIHMAKLRTMHVDAEKGGAQWAGANDPRVHRVGQFLRKYRIDEIPQFWQVLRGNMSFVGPRPERPEIIAMLAKEIPFYEERLMVQPGITGWAQVSYPYGASVLDARRKLEYDLYYMKHMSVFLDMFILLDTVRTILCGGAKAAQQQRPLSNNETILEWERLKAADSVPIQRLELGAA